ncbi:DUF1622 domain-containing protein [Aerococcaceae bacterium DSM 111020]|nr:DUF1622 domain-containing protein [Aerococcaceae bacterium DSM 111020]
MYEFIQHYFMLFSEYVIMFLEFIGVMIILTGSIRTLIVLYNNQNNYGHRAVKIMLGEALALGLEFKMGAEIVHTLVVANINDIVLLAFVVALRIILSLVIHWEVKQAIKDGEDYDSFKEEF